VFDRDGCLAVHLLWAVVDRTGVATVLDVADRRGADDPLPAPEEDAAGRRPGIKAPALLLTVFSVTFVARTGVRYHGQLYFSLFDDAMISMRYAANLAHGHGLVWNPGQPPVEGYTNFGWTLWMALLHVVGLSGSAAVLAVIASAVGLTVVGLWLTREVATELFADRHNAVVAAVWLAALCYPLAFWALRGMEVSLLAVLTTATALLVLRLRTDPGDARKLLLLSGVLALAVFVRTDACLVGATAGGAAIWWAPRSSRRRTVAAVGGGLFGALAVHTVLRLAYYGEILPNTYYLKIAGTPLGARLGRGLDSTVALLAASLLPLAGLAAVALLRHRAGQGRVTEGLMLLAALVSVPVAYSVYVGGDAWEWFQFANRYVSTSLPLLCVLAGLGLADLAESPLVARRRSCLAAGLGFAVALGVAAAGWLPTGSLQYVLPGTQDLADRTLWFLVAMTICAVGARYAVRSSARRWLVGGLIVAAIVMDGQAMMAWARTAGPHVANDGTMAVYGLVIRGATAPTATVAVVWAGASPYYSERPSIDLLGKSDRHIAHEPPQPVPFYPGHTKFDYGWSVGHLRPDLVADLARDNAALDHALAGWGYDELAPKVWVRRDSRLVDRRRLLAGLASQPDIGLLIRSHG
jgi:hypothetical protein